MPRWFDLSIGATVGAIGAYAFMRKPPRLQRRHKYFLSQTGGTTVGISQDLLSTAHILLGEALGERRRPVWRSADNHWTRFAPILIITATTAFDAWMNELVAFGRTWIGLQPEEITNVIDIGSVPEKYERITELLASRRLRPSADLRNLSKLRNEIVHFLPYTQIISDRTVPEWLQYLEQKNLLIASNESSDFHFSQKLGSYALAYWACETIHASVAQFSAAVQGREIAQFVCVDNFRVTAGIHAPEELRQFDQEHKIIVT